MIRSIRPMLIACLSLSLSMTMVACGGDDDGDDESGTPDAGGDDDPADVEVLDADECPDDAEIITTAGLAFVNGDLTISVGDSVLAMPGAGHDVNSTQGKFISGPTGTAACLKFNAAGEYPFNCSKHPGQMTGSITVE
jgi:plastocyanin